MPSVSNFRRQWLMERLEDAQIAALAAEAAPGGQLPKTLRDELLQSVKVKAVAVKRADSRRLILEEDMPAEIDASYDLRDASWLTLIADALMVYVAPNDRVIRVVGKPGFATGEFIEVVMEEAPLQGGDDPLRPRHSRAVDPHLDHHRGARLSHARRAAGEADDQAHPQHGALQRAPGGSDPHRRAVGAARRDRHRRARARRHAGGARRHAEPEEPARRARSRREQDQPRSAQHAVERAAPLRPLAQRQGPSRAASRAEADRLARPRHQAVRPHARFRPGAGDTAEAQARSRSPRSSPRSATASGCRGPNLIDWTLDVDAGARGRCRPRPALPRVEQSLPQRRAGAGERERRRSARSSSPRGARAR